jgi:release factor glutamine methyltransferase
MLPTPSTSHIPSFTTIYEPAEDSYLLLDTLSSHFETTWLRTRFSPSSTISTTTNSPPLLLLEPGPGSGIITAFLTAHATTIFGRDDLLALTVDVNPHACHATIETIACAVASQGATSVYLGSICGDLTTAVRNGVVDVLVFNPPYVPTEEMPALPTGEQGRQGLGGIDDGDRKDWEVDLLALSYAGGKNGMETTHRLLEALPVVLSARGVAYVLLCAQNKPEEVKGFVRSVLNMQVETVGRSGMKAGWEKLQVIRIWR